MGTFGSKHGSSMTSYPSRRGQRDPAVDALRSQVVSAAHRILSEPAASPAFSLELAAARAGVARALVHTQFGSPAGLLSALLDELTTRSALELPRAFAHDDPRATLDAYVAIVGAFWDTERVVMRRLQALAAFEPDLAGALARCDEHRRDGLRRLIQRLAQYGARPARRDLLGTADLLLALSAFATFDTVAGAERKIADVVPAMQSLVRAALGLGQA